MNTFSAIPMTTIGSLVKEQKNYFASGATKDIDFRIKQLKKLYKGIKENENEIFDALKADFGKAPFETYTTEVGMVLEEISLMIANTKKWAIPQLVPTTIVNMPAKSYIYSEPFGNVLVIGAWNYPFQLTILPAVGAIAAGNTVILKPSRVAINTYKVIQKIISENFEAKYLAVADIETEHDDLLAQRYDYIFFTGGTNVGKIVARAAAEHLTPYTLELGGKSPCIVDQTADIEVAAKRIIWGKYINAGQTCVAPDYLLVHKDVKSKLYTAMVNTVREFYGENPFTSADYPRIASDRHYNKLTSLLQNTNVIFGGKTDTHTRYIAPTMVDGIDMDHPLMQDEIFGPILPVFEVDNIEHAISITKQFEKPLAFYIFSNSYANQQKAMQEISFGGGCINDTVAHLANHHLPFGGVGQSGSGAYHGKFSFDTFSHKKGVLNKATWPDVPLRYPPYNAKLGIVKQILK
jgi:aldehyde dehydrogenase (NAD+)